MKNKSKKVLKTFVSKHLSQLQEASIHKTRLLDQHQKLNQLSIEFRNSQKSLKLKPLSVKNIISMYHNENNFKTELQDFSFLLNECLRKLVKVEKFLETNDHQHPPEQITYSDLLISNPFLLHKSSKC